MAERTRPVHARAGTVPGGADPAAVDGARHVLAPLGDRARSRAAPSGSLTTYRVGGAAAVLVTVRRPADLDLVATAARRTSGLPVLVVGRGSNLLVADAGFGGYRRACSTRTASAP